MRLVLDTNVLIASFISHGVCAELLEHAVKTHTLVSSRPLLREFQSILTRKFKIPAPLAAEATRLIALETLIVSPATLGQRVCRDAADDVVLGTAIAGETRAIITGDRDLLDLRNYNAIQIVSPTDFWKFEAEAG